LIWLAAHPSHVSNPKFFNFKNEKFKVHKTFFPDNFCLRYVIMLTMCFPIFTAQCGTTPHAGMLALHVLMGSKGHRTEAATAIYGVIRTVFSRRPAK
jgi:hypothetical protein